jgi:hypothetical protein
MMAAVPHRFARAARLAAAAGLVALMALRRTADWDAYMHLAIGRAALQAGWRLPHDLFSYSAGVTDWRYKDLGADVLFYVGFTRLGYAWFAVLKALAAAAMGAALWLAQPRGRRHGAAWLLAWAALLAAVAHRFAERPQLFSLALFVTLLALIERRRAARADGAPLDRPGDWLPLVALQWAWAQLHREAMVGLVTLAGFALYWTLTRAPRRALAAAWLTAAAATAVSMLNVNGARLWSSSVGLASSPLYRQMLSEWEGLGPLELVRQYPVAALLALSAALALGARALAGRWRAAPVDLWHVGAWLGLAAATRLTLRWLPALASLSALIDLLLLGEQIAGWQGTRPRGATLLAALGGLTLVAATHPQPFGLGEKRDRFPAGALAFARQHGLHQRVVNAYVFGGYVVWTGWPGLRVLVDGRADTVYRPDFVWDALAAERDAGRFAAMRAADGADWVLALGKSGDETHRFLARDPAWRLVYWSEAALVWVRADAYPELAPLALGWVPRLIDASGDAVVAMLAPVTHDATARAGVEAELLRMTAASPDGRRANALLALFYDTMGPAYRDKRDRVLDHLARLQ